MYHFAIHWKWSFSSAHQCSLCTLYTLVTVYTDSHSFTKLCLVTQPIYHSCTQPTIIIQLKSSKTNITFGYLPFSHLLKMYPIILLFIDLFMYIIVIIVIIVLFYAFYFVSLLVSCSSSSFCCFPGCDCIFLKKS